MIALRRRVTSIERRPLAIASLVLFVVSVVALLESQALRRVGDEDGHVEAIESDLAHGALDQLLADSALVVKHKTPAELPEALASLHARRVRAERRIQVADDSADAVFNRLHARMSVSRILGWIGYGAMALITLLWAAYAVRRVRR